jgi:hypothetical protein
MIYLSVTGVLKFLELLELLDQKKLWKEDVKWPSKDKLIFICKRILERLNIKFGMMYIDNTGEYKYKKDDFELPLKYFSIRQNLLMSNYEPKTFSICSQILTILQGTPMSKKVDAIYDFVMEMRDIFIFNFFYDMKYRIKIEDEYEIIEKYKKYIQVNPLIIINDRANIETLKYISRQLYTREIKILLDMENKPTKTILCFRNILNTI